ncbi:unnamed protein product, partial [Lymnaea stagnalis]
MTSLTEEWDFECPPNKPIKNIIADYYSNYRDRVWNISCSETEIDVNFTHCEWSIYVNEFKHLLIYQCPNDGVLTGTKRFSSKIFDRRYQFLCCYPLSYVTHECRHTKFINEHSVLLSYRFPDNRVLRGVISRLVYSDYKPDRLWSLNICKL